MPFRLNLGGGTPRGRNETSSKHERRLYSDRTLASRFRTSQSLEAEHSKNKGLLMKITNGSNTEKLYWSSVVGVSTDNNPGRQRG